MGFFFSGAMPYHRLNSLEMQEKEHKQVMLDLQKWPMEISDALDKCKRLREENESYRSVTDLAWE